MRPRKHIPRMLNTPPIVLRESDCNLPTWGGGEVVIREGPRPPVPPEMIEAIYKLAEIKRAEREEEDRRVAERESERKRLAAARRSALSTPAPKRAKPEAEETGESE